MADETLIFQHIPKTGGITLSLWLLEHFDRERIFHVRHPQHVQAPIFGDSWGTMEDLAALPEEKRSKFLCVMGHMPFGIHGHLPGRSRYITVIRDPVERILSQHGQYNRMVMNQEIEGDGLVSLERYLQLKPSALDNHQTRFLLGEAYHGRDHADRFRLVQENFENHFLLVGVLKRFEETVLVLNQKMRWPSVPYKRENVGSLKSPRTEVPPEFIELIREQNRLDFQVHDYAEELLEEALKSYGPTLEKDLGELRAANRRLETPSIRSRAWELGLQVGRRLLGKQR